MIARMQRSRALTNTIFETRPDLKQRAINLAEAGIPLNKIALAAGISNRTIYYWVKGNRPSKYSDEEIHQAFLEVDASLKKLELETDAKQQPEGVESP